MCARARSTNRPQFKMARNGENLLPADHLLHPHNSHTLLLGSDAVEQVGIIRPSRIAEVGPAVGEGVRAHSGPTGVAQGRACFDDDGSIRCPRDDETEVVGLDAEVGCGGQDDRIREQPWGRWTFSKRRAPPRGSQQVIDNRMDCYVERIRTNSGGVTLEIGSYQASAVMESVSSNGGNAIGDRDVGQASAERERIVPDAGDAGRDADASCGEAGKQGAPKLLLPGASRRAFPGSSTPLV